MDKRQERLDLFERQMDRLNRRIDRLDHLSNRFSWTRVAIFFGGLALSVLAFFVNVWLCAALVVVTLLAFGIVAYYHGKIDRSLARHSVLLHIRRTQLARMRLDWEHIPDLYRPALRADHPFEVDLDITGSHSLHRLLNTAISQEGSTRLANWLLDTSPDLSAIRRRQELVRELTPLTRFRDKLLLHSLIASRHMDGQVEGERLQRWLAQHTQSTALPLLFWATTLINALTLILLGLSLFVTMPQLWIFTLLGGLFLFFTTAKQRGDIFEDASYLRYAFATLSAVFTYLERYPYARHSRVKQLCEPLWGQRDQSPSRLLQQVGRIASAATLKSNGLLWLIVNALVPWDVYCAYRLGQYKERIAQRLPIWLHVWFELEAVCSLATFAYLNPEYSLPEVVPNEELDEHKVLFEAQDLGHPLIPVEKKVINSFELERLGEVIIITGSNMAGKSTFLRTLGVNLCLAYAGGPVDAKRLCTSLFRIFTCIRVSDSVTEGYSYFYAEVRRLRRLLDALLQYPSSGSTKKKLVSRSHPSLKYTQISKRSIDCAPGETDDYPLFFLIDEIFKGTNNRERLIGSRAYIRALVGHNCVGAISTHDLELVKLADSLPQVQNYHFREEVVDGNMVFDYILRPGPCPTTNALKIMQMEGLPVEEEA
jgi:ABC-type multidrug transport system fused ATPase/permease subunit